MSHILLFSHELAQTQSHLTSSQGGALTRTHAHNLPQGVSQLSKSRRDGARDQIKRGTGSLGGGGGGEGGVGGLAFGGDPVLPEVPSCPADLVDTGNH